LNNKADGKRKTAIIGLNCLKGVSGKVTLDEKEIKDSWKEYMEKLFVTLIMQQGTLPLM